jgi:lipoprotein-anchoring transpeptidase ErfK/SrfK
MRHPNGDRIRILILLGFLATMLAIGALIRKLNARPAPAQATAVNLSSPEDACNAATPIESPAATNGAGPNAASGKGFNAVPADTRIVVNAPAYRMDVFDNGKLVKTYRVGIGYPEFPLPTGLRKASDIIFNPTWTPPDSPWVATMKNVKAGEKVEAGSKLNPLGPIKIPIGMPSLIHGGKSPAKIGGFASHGCVGLRQSLAKKRTLPKELTLNRPAR